MLYEQGKFQLIDPLEKYIPEFKDVKVYAGLDEKGATRRKITLDSLPTNGFDAL